MFVHSKVNNKREHNGCDNNISKDYKMDESRIIIDWKEQGDGSYDIEVTGYRNFKQYFSEVFYSIEKPLSVLSVSDSSISGEVACNSATSTLLKYPTNIISNGVKTKGHIFTEKELNLKFPFVDLIVIERFEEITGIRFDHSKFNNRREFQEYFAKWLDSKR